MALTGSVDNSHLIAESGERGMTWAEYAEATGTHHGSASAALSRMHARGLAARLAERRDGGSVYVDPAFIAGRPTKERKATGPKVEAAEIDALIEATLAIAEAERATERLELEMQIESERLRWEIEKSHYDALLAEAHVEAQRARRRFNDRTSRAERRHTEAVTKAFADGVARGREEGEAAGWQDGYDEGIRIRQEAAGNGDYESGRAAGKVEGEDALRRQVGAVSLEMYRIIMAEGGVKAHYNGCWKVHAGCTIKALSRSAGVPVRPMGLAVSSRMGA